MSPRPRPSSPDGGPSPPPSAGPPRGGQSAPFMDVLQIRSAVS